MWAYTAARRGQHRPRGGAATRIRGRAHAHRTTHMPLRKIHTPPRAPYKELAVRPGHQSTPLPPGLHYLLHPHHGQCPPKPRETCHRRRLRREPDSSDWPEVVPVDGDHQQVEGHGPAHPLLRPNRRTPAATSARQDSTRRLGLEILPLQQMPGVHKRLRPAAIFGGE